MEYFNEIINKSIYSFSELAKQMQVFISHDTQDRKLARTIANKLRNDGFEVWDDSQLLPGENWAEAMGKALEESDAMVVLLTPNSVNSVH